MATNKFPTHCITCHQQRPAGHGKVTKVHGKWVCDCKPARVFRDDDDGYDAIKDGMLEDGSWYSRR